MKIILTVIVISVLLPGITWSTIRNVPGSYSTVQAALNACSSGDTVLVQPGTYIETLVWPGVNGICLLGSGATSTIVFASGMGRVLEVTASGIDTTTQIQKISFVGGGITSGNAYGAGTYLVNTSVVFDSVNVEGNRVYVPGGHAHGVGVHLNNSSSVFRNCSISFNSIDSATWCYGAGLYVSGGSPTFENVIFNGNASFAENWCYGVGVHITDNATVTMDRITINDNFSGDNSIWYYGNGMYIDDSDVTISNGLIAENFSGTGGSFNYGGGIYCDGTSLVQLNHMTIAGNYKSGNGSINGSGLYARDAQVNIINSIIYNLNSGAELNTSGAGTITVDYSDIRGGYAGIGNINAQPAFAGAADYHLSITSPCIASASSPTLIPYDRDNNIRPLPAGSVPDMGCYELDQSITGLSTHENGNTILYPNPASSFFRINDSASRTHVIRIYDITGKLLLQNTNLLNDEPVWVNHLKSGIYIVQIEGKSPMKMVIEK